MVKFRITAFNVPASSQPAYCVESNSRGSWFPIMRLGRLIMFDSCYDAKAYAAMLAEEA